MKIKTVSLKFIICLGFFILPAFGQSRNIKIDFASPPANIPICKTQLKTIVVNNKKVTLFQVIVERNLELTFDASKVKWKIENDNYVFPFETSSGNCQVTSNGFEITISDQAQTDSAILDNISTFNNISQPQLTPTVTQNLTATASKADIEKEKQDTKKAALDLSVPESPGFTILGITPQDVIRPATPRKFATALLSSIDRNGNLQSGVAIDTVPYLLLAGDFVTLDKYRERTTSGYLTRLLSRTQFSLATTKGTSEDDKAARIGTGLHLTFFDLGDPRLDVKLDECFEDVTTKTRNQARSEFNLPPLPSTAQPPSLQGKRDLIARQEAILSETYKSEYKKCLDESRERNFARSSFLVGGAGSWISPNGDSSRFRYNGAGIWTSLAYGFEGIPGLEKKSQLIFHFRRRMKEQTLDPLNAGQFITKDSNLFGTRLRFGTPNWTGNIEGLYQGEHFAGRKAESNFQLSFGSDYKIAPNLYLNFSVGGETKKSSISDNKVFVRTSFNWGTSQKPLNEN